MELYQTPTTQFVAGFIGSPAMNFMEVAVTGEGTEIQLDETIRLKLAGKLDVDRVIFGSRPEHLQLADDGELSLTVRLVEHLGAESLIHATLQGTQTPITLRHTGLHHYAIGDHIRATIAANDMHFFNLENQQRLVLS